MRALGEQLTEALELNPAHTVCDLLCDGGVLTSMLAARATRVIAVDRGALAEGSIVRLADRSCDRVASLLTLGFGDVEVLRSESSRILRAGGRVAHVLWDADRAPAFERALQQGLAAMGHDSAFLASVLPALRAEAVRDAQTLHDVARFDGPAHLWSTLVDDRPLGDEVAHLPARALQEVRSRLSEALASHTAADGTMRVPVQALLLS